MTESEHFIRPAGTPPGNGSSHAVAAAGRLVVVSGQLSLDGDGKLAGPGDATAQLRQVFANLRPALAAASATMDQVVKLTVFLTDLADLPAFRLVRDEYVSADRPPRVPSCKSAAWCTRRPESKSTPWRSLRWPSRGAGHRTSESSHRLRNRRYGRLRSVGIWVRMRT